MKRLIPYLLLSLTIGASIQADVAIDGFLQVLYGGGTDSDNPASNEQTASETRLQVRLEEYGENAEVFARLDFLFDGFDSTRYDWELREGYLKFHLGSRLDFKVGRQILTWGTGDLLFINDLFAKDYVSFFIGRDDQYLKAPQNAIRIEFYNGIGDLNIVWTPRFEPDRLPTGQRLSYFDPTANGIVGTALGEQFFLDPPLPTAEFKNSELAVRLNRQLGDFNVAVYFYHGRYKNPLGYDTLAALLEYPRLNVYGISARGAVGGGVLWIEGGFFDSREDTRGLDPFQPNSSVTGLVGYERQAAENLTVNIQWQFDWMLDYDRYLVQQPSNRFVRNEVRHLLTSRINRLFYDELIMLSAFLFYSPSDNDAYLRLLSEYKHTDELTLAAGANIFSGSHENSDFGQFQKNDNVFLKVSYGF